MSLYFTIASYELTILFLYLKILTFSHFFSELQEKKS